MDSAPPNADPQTGSKYLDDFLRILNNRGKHPDSKETDGPARERGFVVIIRAASSLRLIQSLCLEQQYNECLTARYRLQPETAIGTLVAAHLFDLQRLARGEQDITGDLRPISSSDSWRKMAEPYLTDLMSVSKLRSLPIDPLTQDQQGFVYRDHLKLALETLASESVLRAGQRLVLLGELSEEATDLIEWQTAMDMLFKQLPERVGIVLSGAPKDFVLTKGDPHFIEITLPRDLGGMYEQGNLAYRYTVSSFHSDVPAEKDELGVHDYANAIARFVLHPQTKPPLTIGVHGPWGKGKSSFMKLIDRELIKYAKVNNETGESRTQRWNDLVAKLVQLESDIQASFADRLEVNHGEGDKEEGKEQSNEKEKDQKQKTYDSTKRLADELWKTMKKKATTNIISVTFNAWQFEDAQQTWAGLASQISKEMEKTLSWHSRQRLKISYAWKERKTELILNILLPMAVVCLVGGLFSLGSFRNVVLPEKIGSDFASLLHLLVPAGSAFLTIWFVSWQLLKVAQPVSERVLTYVRLPNYREQMGFQNRVKDDLKFVYDFLVKRRDACRVVIYIDDLDRCSENKIMELLQAINLILANCEFFVFVGMDTEMIYRAIDSHYHKSMPARFAENYLRKIVQVSFYLPPETIWEARLGYLDTLFSPSARSDLRKRRAERPKKILDPVPTPKIPEGALSYDLDRLLDIVPIQLKEAEDTADELEAFGDYSGFIDDNPREIKRLINIHRLMKILLQRQNIPWSAERQRKLVKWLIFCDRWPDLVDDVLALRLKKWDSLNILEDLAAKLQLHEMDGKNAVPNPLSAQLREFSNQRRDRPPDVLSAENIDEDFCRAAKLSQLVNESSTLSSDESPATSANEAKSSKN